MILPAAAVLACAALALGGRGRRPGLWGGAAVAFALSIGREPSVLFLALFFLPTVLLAFRRRDGVLALAAASDLFLALALTAEHASSTAWSLASPGGWEAGGTLAGVAAVLRVAASEAVEPATVGAHESVLRFQGIFLAWWAGTGAASVLLAGAAVLVVQPLVRRGGKAAPAGAFALAGAALGTGPGPLAAFGLAGVAAALGERVLAGPLLLMGGLALGRPLAQLVVSPAGGVLILGAAAGLAAASAVVAAVPRGRRGAVTAGAGIALALAASPPALRGIGLYAGAALAASRFFPRSEIRAPSPPAPAPPPVASGVLEVLGLALGSATALVFLRLAAIGISTGFL